jgi:hypothetical protein
MHGLLVAVGGVRSCLYYIVLGYYTIYGIRLQPYCLKDSELPNTVHDTCLQFLILIPLHSFKYTPAALFANVDDCSSISWEPERYDPSERYGYRKLWYRIRMFEHSHLPHFYQTSYTYAMSVLLWRLRASTGFSYSEVRVITLYVSYTVLSYCTQCNMKYYWC